MGVGGGVLLGTAPAFALAASEADVRAYADPVVDAFSRALEAGDYKKCTANFSATMMAALPPERIKSALKEYGIDGYKTHKFSGFKEEGRHCDRLLRGGFPAKAARRVLRSRSQR
ncbi:MAG: DUF3887 domain-containing protein [Deltaproteobacteria bacterium]|nr:DUF3887 domain-containing protein [Deltaproteobacteria bacterium]